MWKSGEIFSESKLDLLKTAAKLEKIPWMRNIKISKDYFEESITLEYKMPVKVFKILKTTELEFWNKKLITIKLLDLEDCLI